MEVLARQIAVAIGKMGRGPWHQTHRLHRLDDQRQIMLLSNENEKLTGQVSRLEERIAVLERIATDNNRAVSLDEEIEKLRDRSHP